MNDYLSARRRDVSRIAGTAVAHLLYWAHDECHNPPLSVFDPELGL